MPVIEGPTLARGTRYRCVVGNPEKDTLVLAFTVWAFSEEGARRTAAERILLLTEENEGAPIPAWGDRDARLYHAGGMTVDALMATIDAQEEETA